ncbi:hypothetical protein JCM5350_003152 [Sporobolomyces pararoseus]
MPIPSLSSLLSYLPSISLPPLIPLPSNLQQRLVSFLLRKTLGGIVKGGLDSERIEADIRDGTFAINKVEIDQHAIAALLESTPTLSFLSGTISNISAKVSYPLAQLTLAVTDVEVVLRVRDQSEAEEWLKQSTDTINATSSSSIGGHREIDTMQESMISIAVAQDFIEHELSPSEDAELRASLHLSPSTAQSDFFLPGAFGGAPSKVEESEKADQQAEEVEKTMLAGLIERILARLNVRVSQIKVRLIWEETGGNNETEEDIENELEIKIDQIEYLGDASSTEEGKQQKQIAQLRAIKVAPPRVFLRLAPRPINPSPSSSSETERDSDSSSSAPSISEDELAQSVSLTESIASLPPLHPTNQSESESESDSSGDENDLLALSQSIADLRTSTASLSTSHGGKSTGVTGGVTARKELNSIDESGGSEMFASATSFVSARSTSGFDGRDSRMEKEGTGKEESNKAPEVDEENPFTNPDSPLQDESAIEEEEEENKRRSRSRLILSLGSPSLSTDPITFYLSTSVASPGDSVRSSRPRSSLHVTSNLPTGWIAALDTTQLAALLVLVQGLSPQEAESRNDTDPPLRSNSQTPLNLTILLRSVTLLLAYPQSPFSETEDRDIFSSLWASKDPSSLPPTSLKAPHLRLQLDEISLTLQDGVSNLKVKDVTLCEVHCEGKEEKQGWKALPILVSDNGLFREGSSEVGGDWTVESAGLTKDWRVKVPATVGLGLGTGTRRKSSSFGQLDNAKKSEAIQVSLDQDGRIGVSLSPLHVFLDLKIVTRLGPVFDALSNAVADDRNGASTPKFGTQHSRPSSSRPLTPAPPPLSQSHLLEDLSSIQPTLTSAADRPSTPTIHIHCPLLRIDLRCPAPRRLRLVKQNDHLLRSGLCLIELEKFEIAKRDEKLLGKVKEARLGIRPFGSNSKLSTFLSISSLSPADPNSVSPSLSFATSSEFNASTSLQSCLPLVHVNLDKRTLDTLQLLADDLSQFFNIELSSSKSFEGSSTEGEREKMIGSRYFGTKSFKGSTRFTKGSRGNGRHSEEEESRSDRYDGIVKLLVEFDVTDLIVDVLLPTSTTARPLLADTKHLRILASDLDVSLTTLEHASDDLRARVEIGDVKVEELVAKGDEDRKTLLARTCSRDLTSISNQPLVKLAFGTSSDPQTDLKESKIELGLEGFTYFFETSHLHLSKDLAKFVKAPEGAFEQVVPNELTRLRLRLSGLSLHLTPPNLSSRVVLSLDDASIKADLMPDLPRTTSLIEVRGAKLWAVQSMGDLRESVVRGETHRGVDFWKTKGFVQLVELQKASITARQGNGLVLPDFELLVSNAKVELSLCADSIDAITTFADDIMNAPELQTQAQVTAQAASSTRTSQPPLDSRSRVERSTADLFASVDHNAFERAPPVHDLPEFLGDDVPANSEYLADTLSRRAKKNDNRSRQSDASLRDRPGRITEDIGGETVRMLTPEGLQIHDDWLAESRCDDVDYSAPASRIRLRISDTDISIHLYEGYDWINTRRAIEEESKAVRRRLEKIRQLLADGQTPDATAENASVLMFGSHQLGLPPGANEMAPKDLIAAIDEELEQGARDEDTVSTAASSWQTFPAGGARSNSAPLKKSGPAVVGRSRKRLTRSKAFAIEVNVRGLNANFDSYSTSSSSPPSSTSQIASKMKVEVSSFDIIDNIKTSTWRKFLTEMRSSDGGLVRASGTPMAKFEIQTAKPAGRVNSAQEEISLKVKISPLRLYIDQDALDFLKAFGAFKAPSPPHTLKNSAKSSSAHEPFYQRVEVLPVKIKLDYKPKRVDYYALKQGKTAELMNFFHFDGSEMVLRHLVVTGVSGTTTLSNLVQDIWTPDVKANQLADVISGIAPVRSVVNVGSGVANLVLLPIEQYRKDGRVVRGLQKGAQAFAKQTTLEAINVGAKLANGTQVILEQAEHVLGAKFPNRITGEALPSSPTVGSTPTGDTLVDLDDLSDEDIKKVRSRYAEQPTDLRQGVESAYKSLGENFKEAAQTILAVPMEVYERSGNEGPVRAVVRAVPIAVLRPMIGASGAVSKALLGLRNSLDPDQQQGELEDKYKPRPPS